MTGRITKLISGLYTVYCEETNKYYVLGFIFNSFFIIEHGFVAEFEDNQIKNITAISEN